MTDRWRNSTRSDPNKNVAFKRGIADRPWRGITFAGEEERAREIARLEWAISRRLVPTLSPELQALFQAAQQERKQ